MSDQKREPILVGVPSVIAWLIGILAVIHLGRRLMDPSTDDWLVELLAFNPARFGSHAAEFPGGAPAATGSFLTHALLHGDLFHLGINAVWLLAVGALVARRMPAPSLLGFLALCAAGGAALFLLLQPGRDVSMIGASGALSGLMAAMFRLLFAADDARDRWILSERTLEARRLSVRQLLTAPHGRLAVAAWLIINFVGAAALGYTGEAAIAWEAHAGGFLTGLVSFATFDRGRA